MLEAIEILESYFNVQGWPADMSQEKLRARHRITVDEAVPECCVVEVERHRGALGAIYIRGLPMSSYETYKMRYAIDVLNETVRELPERTDSLDVSVYALVNEAISHESFSPSIQLEKDGYVVLDSVSKRKALVATLQDVRSFMESFADPIIDYYSERFQELDCLFSENRDVLDEVFRKVLVESLLRKASELWGKRDD